MRSARGHVPLDEVAGRALLMGNPEAARALAAPLAAADPRAIGARLVLAAVARDARADLAAAFRGARAPSAEVPFAAVAPFVQRLAEAAGPEAARRFARALPTERLAPGDAVMARAAADLAAYGALDDAELPLDARIELAARRREPPPDPPPGAVDARHELLALALLRPSDDATFALARRLAPAASRDALVAAALAKISLARGAPFDPGRLATLDPSDPIAAAAALDVARKRGDARAIDPARARLTALARTPAERALVRE
jgi:hypothetical protein